MMSSQMADGIAKEEETVAEKEREKPEQRAEDEEDEEDEEEVLGRLENSKSEGFQRPASLILLEKYDVYLRFVFYTFAKVCHSAVGSP